MATSTNTTLSELIPAMLGSQNVNLRKITSQRNCRFEELESRIAMSVNPLSDGVEVTNFLPVNPPIEFGCTYYEDEAGFGRDQVGDQFQISWTGGAAGTTLNEVRIRLDKNGNGLRDPNETFFDTTGQNGGVYGFSPFHVVSHDGIASYSFTVEDGGQTLVLRFEGFGEDGKFIFTIDVDEWGATENNAIVEGKEFEGSLLTGFFTHPDYHDVTANSVFTDVYSDPIERGLNLPADDFGDEREVQTAGAFDTSYQLPKTGSLSGYVYEDMNDNGLFETNLGEKGISGAQLELWRWVTDRYVKTGIIVTTDSNGYYLFDNLDSGFQYQIEEVQPLNYLDGKDTAGTLGGVVGNDLIKEIPVGPNQHGLNYNFGELKPGSLSGYVYEDDNCNGHRNEGEVGIPNVTLSLWIWDTTSGTYIVTGLTAKTDGNGYYLFDNLNPVQMYQITETQPQGYFEGRAEVGSLGGDAVPQPNTLTNVFVGFDKHGLGYNFGERLPAAISGYVYEDLNDNGLREPNLGEKGIAGVEINLYVWDTATSQYIWTQRTSTTDTHGKYYFGNLDPCQKYSVRETQPPEYIDGKDTPGDQGGTVPEQDVIAEIPLKPNIEAREYNFGELPPATISGYVFQDGDKIKVEKGTPFPPMEDIGTGVLKPESVRISGVVLVLADEKGNPLRGTDGKVITATTNEDGYYEFTMLPAGTYSILETQPTGYEDGIDTAGTTGGVADNPFDEAALKKLSERGINIAALKNDAICALPLLVGEHSQYNNFSEFVVEWIDPPIPPDPPVPVPPSPPSPAPSPEIPVPRPVGGQMVMMSPLMWQPGTSSERLSPLLGGFSAGGPEFTWHLSILNAGYPREKDTQMVAMSSDSEVGVGSETAASQFVNVSWNPLPMKKATWLVRDRYGNVSQRYLYGTEFAKPVVGDFNGDGIDEVAVYVDGNWYIDINGSGTWDAQDLWAQLGTAKDQPIVGDWDGDGKTDIGIFGPRWSQDKRAIAAEPGLPSDLNMTTTTGKRPKNVPPSVEQATNGVRTMKHSQRGTVRSDLIDHVFEYGDKGDVAVTGDFVGDGISTVAVFNAGNWKMDVNGNGIWDSGDIFIEGAGTAGDIPVVGDWNGDGIDKIGVYRNGKWLLDTTGDRRFDTEIRYGESGDIPVVGDFTGAGYSQLGVYRPGEDTSGSRITQNDTTSPSVAPVDPIFAEQYGTRPEGRGRNGNNSGSGNGDYGNRGDQTDSGGGNSHGGHRHGRTMRTPHTDVPLGL